MKCKVLFILFIFLFNKNVNSLNVLIVLPTFIKSHWIVGSSVGEALVSVGHNVTVISPFPLEKQRNNYRDIPLDGLLQTISGSPRAQSGLDYFLQPVPIIIHRLLSTGVFISDFLLKHPNVIALMNDRNEKFDIVIVELFATESLFGLGQYFNASVIGLSSFGSSYASNILTGNMSPLSYIPNPFLQFTSEISFFQRFENALLATYEYFMFNFIFYEKQKQIFEKYFPSAKMTFTEVHRNGTSMMLMNSHFSTGILKPYLPNCVDIGGIQIDRQPKSLPDDLQQFIDSAEHGAILFSLGSTIQSKNLTVKIQQEFIAAFSKLKQRIVWKFDKEDLKNLSSNILIRSWLPQNSVLAHSNIKLFITHGGLLSLTEAVYHGVPVVGIPIFGDQKLNIANSKQKWFGFELSLFNLTEASILNAIHTVLWNKSFSRNAKRISNMYRDQPMTPKASTIYWIEYVARHNGAPQLQSVAQSLSFFEYHMIDVFAVILFSLILFVILILLVLKTVIIKLIRRKSKIE